MDIYVDVQVGNGEKKDPESPNVMKERLSS